MSFDGSRELKSSLLAATGEFCFLNSRFADCSLQIQAQKAALFALELETNRIQIQIRVLLFLLYQRILRAFL